MKYQLVIEDLDPGAVTLLVRDIKETLHQPDVNDARAKLSMVLDLEPDQVEKLNTHLGNGFWGHSLQPAN
jgi:hypothetical protein